MTFQNKFLSTLIAIGMISSTISLAANPYQGCKGTDVMKSKGKSADISKELESSHQRVQKICKELDGKVKKVNSQAVQCINGSGEGEKALDLLTQFTENVQNACDKMKANLKTAQQYCADRSASLKDLDAKIKGAASPIKGAGPQGIEAQSAAFTKQKGIYTDSKATFTGLAAKSESAANEIYDTLPDRDEVKRNQRGVAAETEDTKDPKLDALVTNMQNRFQKMAQDKSNKNAKYCQKIASKNGDFGDISETLKKNLWPNGKKSARAISSMSTSDKIRAQEYDGLAAKAGSEATHLGAAPDAADPAVAGGGSDTDVAAKKYTPEVQKKVFQSQLTKEQEHQMVCTGGLTNKCTYNGAEVISYEKEQIMNETDAVLGNQTTDLSKPTYNPNVKTSNQPLSAAESGVVLATQQAEAQSGNGSANDGNGSVGYTPPQPVVNRGPSSEVSTTPTSPSVSQLGGGQCCYSYGCSLNPFADYDGQYNQNGQCVPK